MPLPLPLHDGDNTQFILDTIAQAHVTAGETAFSTYKALQHGMDRFNAAAAGTYLLGLDGNLAIGAANASAGLAVFYLDPADYTAGARTTNYRNRASLLANATASTVSFTVGLYPVTAVAGGAAALTITLGTVVSGSTVLFTTPGANSMNQNSSAFTAPAAGWYALGVVLSGNMAANSSAVVRTTLQMRQV